ncbi:hypothetical protein [Armatimonas sp.]|uniref:hypothetical protein n=1 Tax=Armatimonas sp. TaxID=1872638 RepID=UPI0037511C0B
MFKLRLSFKAGDGSVTKALKATDLAGAKKLVGKDGAFEGTVVKVFSPSSNGLVILNFDKNYADFPDIQSLKGKHVLISGKFDDFKGSPEIVLARPDQLKLVVE